MWLVLCGPDTLGCLSPGSGPSVLPALPCRSVALSLQELLPGCLLLPAPVLGRGCPENPGGAPGKAGAWRRLAAFLLARPLCSFWQRDPLGVRTLCCLENKGTDGCSPVSLTSHGASWAAPWPPAPPKRLLELCDWIISSPLSWDRAHTWMFRRKAKVRVGAQGEPLNGATKSPSLRYPPFGGASCFLFTDVCRGRPQPGALCGRARGRACSQITRGPGTVSPFAHWGHLAAFAVCAGGAELRGTRLEKGLMHVGNRVAAMVMGVVPMVVTMRMGSARPRCCVAFDPPTASGLCGAGEPCVVPT